MTIRVLVSHFGMKCIMCVSNVSLELSKNTILMSYQVSLCVIPFYIQYFRRQVSHISYTIDWLFFEFIGLSHIVIPGSPWLSLNPLESVCRRMYG